MTVQEQKFSWYQVPDDVKHLLALATENWENTAISEGYINQALAQAAESPDVLIAAYRYFFYKNNPLRALQIATQVLNQVKVAENLPDNWEELKPLLLDRRDEPRIRLYLNAYAASGFVLAKLGEVEKALEIGARVKEIDNRNEFGASVIVDILTKPPEDDD